MTLNRFTSLLIALLLCFGTATAKKASNEKIIEVAQTQLASLRSAQDVLIMVPGVTFKGNQYRVSGRGVPEIYIGKRKVPYIDELDNLPASYIQDIKLITEPGAEYEKGVQAVIIIDLIKEHTEGIIIDNNLSFKYNSYFAPADRLALSYSHFNYQIGGQLGITESRSKQSTQDFTHSYSLAPDIILLDRQHETATELKHSQNLTAKLFAKYDINMNHSITASYFVDWQRRNDTHKWDDVTTVYGAENGHYNPRDIISCDTVHFMGTTPTTRHELNVEYHGTVGNVTITAGNATLWNRSFDTGNKFAVKNNAETEQTSLQYNNQLSRESRTYASASMPLYNGTLGFGTEVNMRHMNALLDEQYKKTDGIHGITDQHTYAGYINASQEVGIWSFAAGLRYENIGFKYEACDDDEGLKYSLFDEVKFDRSYHHFYPNAMAAVKLGNSKLSLSYARSYNQVNMANIKVHISSSFRVSDYLLLTERISSTVLDWTWKWVEVNAAHRHYDDPLCHTTDGNIDFNGKNYNALDFNINLTPQFGIWKPTLTLHSHKQWFNIKLSDGRTCLNSPLYEVQWFNTFTLPQDWSIRLNGNWHSKGCDRNVRYYKGNFQLDAAIQKNMLNNKFTVELSGSNLLRGSWDDVTIYTDYHEHANKGHKNRIERSVILSLTYKL